MYYELQFSFQSNAGQSENGELNQVRALRHGIVGDVAVDGEGGGGGVGVGRDGLHLVRAHVRRQKAKAHADRSASGASRPR